MFWKDIDLKVEQIYNDYGKLIAHIAYQIVGDRQLAEDITQETIERIIKNPSKINDLHGVELKNYIARIASNTSKDFLKKMKSDEDHVIYLEDSRAQDIEDKFDLEEFIITKNTKERLKQEIRKMDDKYRDPLTLHNLNEHTISETSNLLGVPERTVKHRIKKAMNNLRNIFLKGDDSNE